MTVTFGTPVSSTTGSVSLTGISLGQPIILIVDITGPTNTITDTFATGYTWTKVDQGSIFSNASLATVYQTMYIGTGGYGSSGTINVAGGSFITAVPCIGASGATGLAAVDVHGNNTANNGSAGSPTLTPTTTGEGAVVAIYPVEFPDFVWVSAHPGPPWVATNFLPFGYTNPPIATATYASPPASALTAAWVQSNPSGSPDLNYVTTGAVIKVFTAIAPSAPTLQAPVNGSFQEASGGLTFNPIYNAADNTPMSKYELRLRLSGGTYGYWNGTDFSSTTPVPMTLTALPGATFSVAVASGVAVPGGTLVDGHAYGYSFACANSAGTFGSFATDATFTAQAAPVTTISQPAGTVHGTTQPTVAWSSTFPGAAIQTAYRVIIESGSYGTSPGSGVSAWDSGTVTSTALSVVVGTPLSTGTNYRAFVIVTETGPENGLAHSDFTLVVDLPAPPTVALTTVADPTSGLPEFALTGQGNDNLLTANQSSLEAGTTTGLVATLNCTITASTVQALDGTYSMRMSSTAAGRMDAGTLSGTSGVPVVAGQQYTAMASFFAPSSSRQCYVAIYWSDFAGAALSNVFSGSLSDHNNWLQNSVTAVAPAGAAYAQVVCSVQSPGAGSELHYVDQIKIAPGPSTVWSIGGFVGTTEVVILRSDGNYVRGASPDNPYTLPLTTQAFTIYDPEAPTDVATTYYVFVIGTSGGQVLTGTPTTTGAETLTSSQWWVWIPGSPAGALPISRASKIVATLASGGDASMQFDQDEDQGVFKPFGRSDTLVVHGDMRGEYFTLLIVFTSDAAWNAFVAMRNQQRTVAVRSDMASGVYFMTMGASRSVLVLRGDRNQPGGANRQLSMDFLPSVRPTP